LSTLLDYKIDVKIEDLFEVKQYPEETAKPVGTRVTITIPIREEQ
jgi:hypothetical protein